MKRISEWSRSEMFGWWYVCIGVGFVLLGINRLVLGDRLSMAALRWLVAAGFFALGYYQLKYVSRKPKE